MPTATITCEPWCQEHLGNTDTCGHGEMCTIDAISFGSNLTDRDGETYPRGTIFVDQSEGDEDPKIHLEFWPARTGEMDLDALRSIREALKDDPAALLTIVESTLIELEKEMV